MLEGVCGDSDCFLSDHFNSQKLELTAILSDRDVTPTFQGPF